MKESKKKHPAPGTGKQGKKGGPSAKQETQGDSVASKIWDDERFAHLINDPRYRGMPKSKKKVQIDNRFKAMFEDGRFNERATVDKYGRKVKQTPSEELKRFYELEESDEEAERLEREQEERAMEGRKAEGEESDSEAESTDGLELNEEEKHMDIPTKVKNRLKDLEVDYARGEGLLLSESSSDDDEDDEAGEGEDGEDEVFIEHVWGELDADAERTEESTSRLAVLHMDWDRIRAVDIMVLLNSFLTPGASLKSVTIYPSEYGKERMKEEEERGPQMQPVRGEDDSEADGDEEDDEEAQKERLREYQLNRLKYYYAVAECDSVATADRIYKECDGVEYESTANKLDLRFIPDDMEFDDDEAKDRCVELPDMSKYVPRVFTTTALTQAKVELTWDENDPERKEFGEKLRDGKWAQMPEEELKKYVACSSSEEDEEEEGDGDGKAGKKKRSVVLVRPVGGGSDSDSDESEKGDRKSRRREEMIAKYKALLNDVQEQTKRDDRVEMEFTWEVNGGKEKEKVKNGKEEHEDEQDEETDAKKPQKAPDDDVNPFEKILQKKREKSKRRKELKKRRKRGELDGSGSGESGGEDSSEDDLPAGVDLNDPFFASAFDEKEFGGPGNKSKSSKRKEAIRQAKEQEERDAEEQARRKAELELLLDDGDGDNRSHFNLRAIQESEIDLKSVSKSKRRRILRKSKREVEEQRAAKVAKDDFQVDVEDARFGAIFSKPEYNIDPTNPAFKKTKAMERLIEYKLQKRRQAENDGGVAAAAEEQQQGGKKAKKDVATSMLVKSIKRKIGKTA